MEKGFNAEKFMAYLEQEFNGMENCMLRQIVENLINYGHKHEQISKDQFVQWLADMEDDCLTENGKREKQAALKNIKWPMY